MIDEELNNEESLVTESVVYDVIYTNGTILQTYPIPEGPEWRVATQEDIDRIEAEMQLQRDKLRETTWQTEEMLFIANQLLAIEEEAEDALPGTRTQWLAYRTKVRLWHASTDFPDITKRPVRPS